MIPDIEPVIAEEELEIAVEAKNDNKTIEQPIGPMPDQTINEI